MALPSGIQTGKQYLNGKRSLKYGKTMKELMKEIYTMTKRNKKTEKTAEKTDNATGKKNQKKEDKRDARTELSNKNKPRCNKTMNKNLSQVDGECSRKNQVQRKENYFGARYEIRKNMRERSNI